MLQHIVFLRFKPNAEEELIQEYIGAVGELPRSIPRVIDFTYGRDVGKTSSDALASNWDFAVTATFRTFDDYLHYSTHPTHVALIETYLPRLMQDRAALQIERDLDRRDSLVPHEAPGRPDTSGPIDSSAPRQVASR